MRISGTIRSRIAMMALAGLLLAIGQQATAAAAVAAPNCTTSHCATIQVVVSQLTPLGSGTVTSSDGGIDCVDKAGVASGTCSEKVSWPLASPTTKITLAATPTVGSLACFSSDGANFPCNNAGQPYVQAVVLSNAASASAQFMFQLTQVTLVVYMSGTGTGTVLGNSVVVSCPAGPCGRDYDYGQVVTFTTASITGSFSGWGRDCAGQGATCTLAMTTTRRIDAAFNLPAATPTSAPTPAPTPTLAPPSPTPAPVTARPTARSGNSGPTQTQGVLSIGGSPGSSILGATGIPSAGDNPSPSVSAPASAATSTDPNPASPSNSGDPPWLPIILVVVLVVAGANLMIFQVMRGRRPRA